MKRGDLIIFDSKNYSVHSRYARNYVGKLYMFLGVSVSCYSSNWAEVVDCGSGIIHRLLRDDLKVV